MEKSLYGSKILILGGDGFLGTELVRYFSEQGWQVFASVMREPQNKNEYRLNVLNIEDFLKLPTNIPLINAIGLPSSDASASLVKKVHVQGMKNIVQWAKRMGCPYIIQMSSVAVYGNRTIGQNIAEHTTDRVAYNVLKSNIIYGRTKARGEIILERSGIGFTHLRLPAIYGPYDSFFTKEIYTLLHNNSRKLPLGGDKLVSIIPVSLVPVICETLLGREPIGEALNATGAHISWNTILECYAKAWNRELRFATKFSWKDLLNSKDKGRQMAASYGRWGAHFSTNKIETILGQTFACDWESVITEAASHIKK